MATSLPMATQRGCAGPQLVCKTASPTALRAPLNGLSRQGAIRKPVCTRAAAERVETESAERPHYLDPKAVESMVADFPLSYDEMVEKALVFFNANAGSKIPELLADDFQFVAPVVGPISKTEYLNVIGNVDFYGSIPDLKEHYYGAQLDPLCPGRMWMFTQPQGTHTGVPMLGAAAEGKRYESCPQMTSLTFNEEGKVVKLTVGYCIDRTVGNTGGLGGLYGLLYAIGKPLPFPEANPWKMSKRYWFFTKLGMFAQRLQKKGE